VKEKAKSRQKSFHLQKSSRILMTELWDKNRLTNTTYK